MARVTFRKGIEANLPTQGLAEEGCVYLATDTGNVYVGDSNGSLVPLNRSPYYGTCSSVGSTNSKVVTLDVEDDNFSLYAGAMISVRFDNANIASSPTLNVNGTGAVAVKDYGTTNIDTSSESWSSGEVVTFVYDGSYWQRVGSKKKVSELHSRGFVGETGSADSIATTTGVLTFKNIARVAANSFPCTNNANAILDINTYSNNSYNHQIGFSSNGKLYHRHRAGSWAVWKELYHLGDDISTEYLKEPNHSIYTATTLPLISTTRANRLALLPADQIIVEQTTDGGTTWVDAGVTDAQKNSLCHGGTRNANIRIPLLDGVRSKLCGIRITITGMKYDVPSGTTETEKYNYWNKDYPLSSERYVSICGMYFWIAAISDRIRVRVYRATGAAPNSWISASNEDAYLSGTAGGGYISIPSNAAFGGGITQTANSWNYRIVFFTDGNNGGDLSSTNPTSAQYIYRIFGYGSNCWNFSNRLMVNDHLYDWGFDQTIITPSTVRPSENVSTADLGATDGRWRKIYGVDEDLSGDIRANKLIKVGGTRDQFLKADGSVDSNTYLTESSGSGTFVKVKPVNGFYNNNDSWNAYFADSSFSALKYIRITLPDTAVNVWTMLYFEISIMQSYTANRYGKLLLFGWHSSSATNTWSLNGALSGTLENIFVYGSDKKYIYIKGVQRYGSISINKIMSGDTVSLIDISGISIDVVDSLPETYQTATIQGGGGGTSTDVRINGTSITDNNVANIVTEGAYNASTNKIATMSDLPNDANVVHKTGNETIAGVKTFADNVVVGESKQVVLNTGQDGYVYLDAWADNSGKTLSVLDENDFDVRLQGVDTPIANNDAANKAYVDSVASGGASLNVGNSKVFFGTSTTGASTTTKDVTCADFTSSDLVEGVMVLVKFSTKNTGAVASLKLNVNGTGAYNIKKIYYTSGVTNLTNAAEIAANSVIPFIFTGSYWLVAGLDYNTNTTYSAMTSEAISAGTETTGRLVTAKLLKDNLVYKTGNENVAGVKTFTDGVLVKDSDFGIVSEKQSKHSVYLSVDNYYDDGSEGIGVLSLDDPSGYGDVIVRCVANPIQSTDAANKAYVDSVIGGSRSILDGCSGVHGLKKYSICAIDAVDEEMYPFINQSTNVVESGVSFRIGTNIYYYEGDDMGSEDDFTGVPFYTSNSNVPLSRNMIGSFGSADLPAHAHYYMKVTVNSSNGTWSPSAGSSGTLIVHQNLLEQGCFYIHLGYENGEQDSFTLEEENPLYYFNGTNLVPYESYETSNCVHKTGTETIGGAKTFSTSCTVPNPTNLYHAATKKYVDDIVGDIETLLAAI